MTELQKIPHDDKGEPMVETDSEKTGGVEDYVVDRQLEKKLLRKLDLHVLPMVALMYLFK